MSAGNKFSLIYDLIVDEGTDQACATEEENSALFKEMLIHPLLKRKVLFPSLGRLWKK